MSSTIIYHYTYQITNTKLNKHYIGVRSCNKHPTKDLGIKYFSSSTNKEFIFDQKLNINNYEYRILGLFETREAAYLNEIELHETYDVAKNHNFYNKAKATSTRFDNSEAKEKRIKSILETRKRKKEKGISYSPSKETIEKMLISKLKNGTTLKGVKKTASHIEKMKLRIQDTLLITCPYCNKTGAYKNMYQWHLDNCRQNPNRIDNIKIVTCSVCGHIQKRSVNFYQYHEKHCKFTTIAHNNIVQKG